MPQLRPVKARRFSPYYAAGLPIILATCDYRKSPAARNALPTLRDAGKTGRLRGRKQFRPRFEEGREPVKFQRTIATRY